MTTSSKIVWFVDGDKVQDNIREKTVLGQLSDAVNSLKDISRTAGFILGQILDHNGKVLANAAPNGVVSVVK